MLTKIEAFSRSGETLTAVTLTKPMRGSETFSRRISLTSCLINSSTLSCLKGLDDVAGLKIVIARDGNAAFKIRFHRFDVFFEPLERLQFTLVDLLLVPEDAQAGAADHLAVGDETAGDSADF